MTLPNLPGTPVLIANYFGDSGGSTSYYYWVQAVYPFGYGPMSNYAGVTVLSLSHSNVVALNWTPMPGAVYYLVYRTTTSTPPSGTVTALIAGPLSTADGLVDNGITALSVTVPTSGIAIGSGSGAGGGQGVMNVAHVIWNVTGGDTGTQAGSPITPPLTAQIPANAIIVGATINTPTAFVGTGATVAIGTSAGSAANSIKTATAITSFTTDALVNGTVTFAAPVKMSAAGNVTFTVATADVTAGVLELFVYYVVASNA